MNRAAVPGGSAALGPRSRGASKNRGPDPAHGSWLVPAAMPPGRQLEVGTDLPSTAPVAGVRRRAKGAQLRRTMSFVPAPCVVVGRRRRPAQAGAPAAESTAPAASVSRRCRGSRWGGPELSLRTGGRKGRCREGKEEPRRLREGLAGASGSQSIGGAGPVPVVQSTTAQAAGRATWSLIASARRRSAGENTVRAPIATTPVAPLAALDKPVQSAGVKDPKPGSPLRSH